MHGSYTFNLPRDATVDNSGNLWVVDKHRAVQYSASGTYLQSLPENDPWQSGNDNTHFNEPYGIAFDQAGRMFIADSQNHRVQVYTFSGGKPVYNATIGVTGVSGNDNMHFNTPYRLAVDGVGQLYVVDNRNNRVQRCVLSGAWSCTTLDGGLNNPQGIAVDGNANVYIADAGNSRIRKCISGGSCSNFTNVTGWTTDLVVDSNGDVYTSTQSRHAIRKFSSTGNLIGTHLGVEGVPYLTDGNHYNHPRVAIDGDDNIIVLEENGQRLLKLSPSGTLLWAVGEPGVSGNDNAHFNWPHGVAVGNDRRIYVADSCRVQIFSGNGAYMTTLGTGCGTGDYQFGWATGIAVDDNDYIYVSDASNHRVQIYDNNRVFVGRIGVTGQCGTDNDHLCAPIGADVDSSNNIYVADIANCRVQKFDRDRNYLLTVGITRSCGNSLVEVSAEDVAVDTQGRIYVSGWNNRVQVFDATGAYLTTIGGAGGNKSSQFRGASGVDVDRAGNVYVADFVNSRVQKFAPGVAGWQQVNINGFGDRYTVGTPFSSAAGGYLYMPVSNGRTGGELWRSSDGNAWQQINPDGFGDVRNTNVYGAVSFGGYLYAGTSNGTTGGEIWRSPEGVNWQQANLDGFGDANNKDAQPGTVFGGYLYVDTYNQTTGCELWRSTDGSVWEQANTDGFGYVDNFAIGFTRVFNGYLYAGVANNRTGGELWRSSNGTTWERVISNGFGDALNPHMLIQIEHAGYLYVGAGNNTNGVKLWRSADGAHWDPVNIAPFANSHDLVSYDFMSSAALDGMYYVSVARVNGLQVWRTADFVVWEQIMWDGFGDSNNTRGWLTTFGKQLYVGTGNDANGSEVWQYLSNRTYLPIVLRQ